MILIHGILDEGIALPPIFREGFIDACMGGAEFIAQSQCERVADVIEYEFTLAEIVALAAEDDPS